jgi:transcriptional/translational regulatory protein YebC/TACO1
VLPSFHLTARLSARLAPVAYQFSRCGQIRLTPADGTSFEDVWDLAIDSGAEDVTEVEAEASESGSPEIMVSRLSFVYTRLAYCLLYGMLDHNAS